MRCGVFGGCLSESGGEGVSVSDIERSLIKKFRKEIWCNFVKSVKKYNLISEGDRIAVCVSGGKDSFALAKCMQELSRHGQFTFENKFIVMDPGYTPKNRALIEENAKKTGVEIEIFPSEIFAVVDSAAGGSPCYLCARMRRGYLYEYAQKLGCNKIALGHHFDDVVETTLMSMLYGAEIKTMLPKLRSTSHPGMELIRPLYGVRERHIIEWAQYNNLTFLRCACRFTERLGDGAEDGKRREMKQLVAQLEAKHPDAAKNIFISMHNVALDCIVGWRKDGARGDFTENY